MKKLTGLLLALLITILAMAQSSQTIRGVVIDKTSEKPLPGVTVQLVGTDLGAITDSAGRYALTGVPLGRQQISYGSAGYHSATIPEVLVTAGKEVILDIALEQRLVTLKTFTITAVAAKKGAATNEFSAGSARSFSVEDVTRYAGGRNDPSKLVSNYAGVVANSDARNDIVVRGNSPAGVLWRIEGSPSPSPNHFSTLGTTGGPVSALNTNVLKNSDFLTGAFPAEYGNATAAVFDISLRSGNSARHETTLQVNAFSGLEATVEGPLNKKNNGAAYLASYRYAVAQLANAVGINIGTKAVPHYQDWAFNITTGKGALGRFSFFGMGGLSHIDLIGSKTDSTDFYGQADQDAYDKSNFSYFGIKNTLDIDSRTYLRTVVTYAHTLDNYDQYRYPDPVPPYHDRWLQYTNHTETSTARFSTYLNQKMDSRFSWRLGIAGEALGLKLHRLNKIARPPTAPFDTVSNYEGTPFLLQYFGQFKYRVSESFSIVGGLHGTHLDVNNSAAIEPRLSFNYQLPAGQSISLSYGLHSQLQPLPVYFQTYDETNKIRDSSNKDLGLTSAHHFVASYEWRFLPGWRFKAEAYYQYLYNVPVERASSGFSMLNAGADFGFPDKVGLINKGTGTNKGVELTLERFLNNGYYLLFTTSLFDSKYKGSDGIERNTAFNYKYVVNALAGREWRLGSSSAFTVDIRLSTIGGRYATPVNVAASLAAGYQIDDTLHYNSERLSDYFRLDTKFGYRTNSKKHRLSSTFYLDLQNVTNRRNIFLLQYDQAKGTATPIYQIRFFPDILYRIQF